MAVLSVGQRIRSEQWAAIGRQPTRFTLGLAQLVATILFLIGTAWDIQWHTSVGRDRLFTTPHLVMLAGIAGVGLVSLAAIVAGSWRPAQATNTAPETVWLGIFHAPLGAYIAGFGALSSLVAFPLDDYWHTLYGVDVTLWAPFHVMIISGLVLAALGATYTLYSATHQIQGHGTQVGMLAGTLSEVVALATLLSMLFLFLGDTLKPSGLITLPFVTFELYPAIVAAFGSFVLAAAVVSRPKVGLATLVALVYLTLREVMFVVVPWATDLMVRLENQVYRESAPPFTVVPHTMPGWLIAAAVLVDLAYFIARRCGFSADWLVLTALVAGFVAVGQLDQPWLVMLNGHYGMRIDSSVVLASLPLAVVTASVGGWLGLGIGRDLAEVTR